MTKQEVIAQLKQDILSWQGFKPAKEGEADSFGLGPIESAFPNGVFPVGVLHEFISQRPEQTAATGGFIAGLMQTMLNNGGVCIWVSYTRRIYPPSLKRFGVSPDRVIFIDVKRERDVLWVTEEALKCAGIAAVVCETRLINQMESRRLQLATEESRVTCFIMHKDAKVLTNTICAVRWAIRPIRSKLREGMPGVGHPRWQVELLRVKNGKTGVWPLEWKNKAFKLVTVQEEKKRQRYA